MNKPLLCLHPLICILSFLVFSIALAITGSSEGALLAAILILMLCYLTFGRGFLSAAWSRVRRMRWFFLSLVFFYFWMTPGVPVFPYQGLDLPWWMPTVSGVETGMYRVLVLVAIILAGNLVLAYLDRAQLVSAICSLVQPLSWLGLSSQRFSVRFILTLESIAAVQTLVRESMNGRLVKGGGHPVHQIGRVTAAIFQGVISQAEQTPCHPVLICRLAPAPHWQWGIPIALFAVFFSAQM